MRVKSESEVAWSCLTLSDPIQARVLLLNCSAGILCLFCPHSSGELKEESGNHLSKKKEQNTFYPQAGGKIDTILKHSVVMKE